MVHAGYCKNYHDIIHDITTVCNVVGANVILILSTCLPTYLRTIGSLSADMISERRVSICFVQ